MPGGGPIGPVPPLAAETTVSLVGPGDLSATIVASVPLNDSLVRKLHARSGLIAPDELAIVRQNGRISAASTATLRGTIDVTPGRVETATIGDDNFRALGAARDREAASSSPPSPRRLRSRPRSEA